MKYNNLYYSILFGLILIFFGLTTTNGQANIQYDHRKEINKYKSFEDMQIYLKYGLEQNEANSIYKSLSTKHKTLLKTNSNFVLSSEIIEITPPWGDPSKDKSEYSYNENGINTQVLRSAWDNNDWVIRGRGNLTYDELFREIELLNEVWENSKWKDWFKQTTSYHSNGQVLEVVGYFKFTAVWETSSRQTNIFDDNNILVESLFEWANGSSWTPSSKTEYKYDENGKLVEEIYLYNENGAWNTSEKYILSYDEFGNIAETLTKMWNGSSWDDSYKQIFSYGENQQLLTTLGYIRENNIWRNNTRWMNTYDENNNNTESLFEQNWDGSGWQLFEKTTREFNNQVTEVEDNFFSLPTEYSIAQNYPNPFNPTTTISYSIPENKYVTLSIYDALGKEIAVLDNGFRIAGNYSHTFDASNLSSGMYFFTIRSGNFVQTKKMLLMK